MTPCLEFLDLETRDFSPLQPSTRVTCFLLVLGEMLCHWCPCHHPLLLRPACRVPGGAAHPVRGHRRSQRAQRAGQSQS